MPRLPSRPTAGRLDRLRADVAFIGVGRILATVLAGLALFAGAWWVTRSPATSGPAPFDPAAAGAAPVFTLVPPVPEGIVVHVVGAVRRPGVYQLDPGARVVDAVETAGGPSPEAVLEAINLAATVSDGQRIRVPTVDDPLPVDGSVSAPSGESAVVDINSADVDQLDALPGVGPALAAAIVGHRERHGAFESIDDLVAVSGIGPAKLEVLRPLITIGGSPG